MSSSIEHVVYVILYQNVCVPNQVNIELTLPPKQWKSARVTPSS